jgi:site-specific DNA-cytosine methylase
MAESPFRKDAQRKLIGNGVPISMGRAIAKAVKKAIDKR